MNLDFKEQVWRGGFRPTADAEAFEDRLRSKLGLGAKYESARLSIGRSLAEPSDPEPVGAAAERGKAIPGEHLFGEEVDLWISVLVEDGNLGPNATVDDFRHRVEAHWARGAHLLRSELEECHGDEVRLVAQLADLLPRESGPGRPIAPATRAAGEIRIPIGPISRAFPDGERVELVLNGPGTSPHIALMGKAGRGKTTTGLQIAFEIHRQAGTPFLIIDPKGEFVDNGQLTGTLAAAGIQAGAIEAGQQPIPLDFLPDPGVGGTSITKAAMQLRDTLSMCCRGVGDIQQTVLRQAIEGVIKHERPRDLKAIRMWYRQELENAGKKPDSVLSRLEELTALNMFIPGSRPHEFFSKSWVISLKSLSEELKRLVVLMLLDSLKSFILPLQDTPVREGYRDLRHLLVVDEARRVLAEKRYESLVDLVRQGRSKGQVVMLLSQDPSDFDGQADDFTTQLGTVISFACAQGNRGLRALQGAYGRRLQPQEFSDTFLPVGVAFVKLPNREAERVHCWGGDAMGASASSRGGPDAV